jgi:hypothetical protein
MRKKVRIALKKVPIGSEGGPFRYRSRVHGEAVAAGRWKRGRGARSPFDPFDELTASKLRAVGGRSRGRHTTARPFCTMSGPDAVAATRGDGRDLLGSIAGGGGGGKGKVWMIFGI